MSSEQQRNNQGGVDWAQIMPESTASITSENTAQILPESTAQTQVSAETDGSPDGRNGKDDKNAGSIKNDGNGKNDTNVKNGKKRKKLIGLLATAAVLIAAAVGIGIYNAPSNRMNRALDLGARYLEEQNYEQALVEFDKVIAIDPMNVDAYLGKAEAYEGMGDTEQLLAVLQTGYEQTGDSQIKTELTDTYLEQASGYEQSADYESAVTVYDKLQELDGEDQKIQDSLSSLLLKQASDYVSNGDYDKAFEVYDRLLELNGDAPEVQKALGDLLNDYLRQLIDKGNYDEAKSLIEKYQDKEKDVDFQAYLDEIEEIERIEAENKEFLQKVFDLMAAQDYRALCELCKVYDYDPAYETVFVTRFVERMEQDSLVYVPENNVDQTGKGAGIYRYYEENTMYYYFYYGDMINGSREGEGSSFMINFSYISYIDGMKNRYGYDVDYNYAVSQQVKSYGGSMLSVLDSLVSYFVFTGHWENDAPNGEGTLERNITFIDNIRPAYQDAICSGNLIDGLWDGPVIKQVFGDDLFGGDYTYDLSFTAVRGAAQEDVTEEFKDLGYQTDFLEEGGKIYAFDVYPNGQFLYSQYSWTDEDGLAGIFGFGKTG